MASAGLNAKLEKEIMKEDKKMKCCMERVRKEIFKAIPRLISLIFNDVFLTTDKLQKTEWKKKSLE